MGSQTCSVLWEQPQWAPEKLSSCSCAGHGASLKEETLASGLPSLGPTEGEDLGLPGGVQCAFLAPAFRLTFLKSAALSRPVPPKS
jgi:hypothetical protein